MINDNPLLQSQRLQSNLRYTLCSNMMNEYFIQFLNSPNTMSLVENMIKDVKKNNLNISTSNPIFLPNKPITKVMPPSPDVKSLNSHQSEKTRIYGTNPTNSMSDKFNDINSSNFNTEMNNNTGNNKEKIVSSSRSSGSIDQKTIEGKISNLNNIKINEEIANVNISSFGNNDDSKLSKNTVISNNKDEINNY